MFKIDRPPADTTRMSGSIGWLARRTSAVRRRLRGEDGISLAEMLVAMSILLVVMAGVGASVTQSLAFTRSNRDRVIAANITTYELERMRAIPFAVWAFRPQGLTGTFNRELNGVTYTVTREARFITPSTTASDCTTAPGDQRDQYVRVSQTIDFSGRLGVQPVRNQTIIRPTSLDAYSGNIAVTVRDRDGQGAAGHLVRVTGTQARTETTDSAGCAYFAAVPDGPYTVELSTAGYIDRAAKVTNPQVDTAIAPGATQSLSFEYDRIARLSVTPVPEPAYSGPTPSVPADLGYSIKHTDLNTLGRAAVPDDDTVTTTVPFDIEPLYPYLSGYGVHTGRCALSSPEFNGAAAAEVLAADPGQTTAGTVATATVLVFASDANGDPVGGAQVTATHPTDANGCTESLELGVTAGDGSLTSLLPYGTWEIQVTGGIGAFSSGQLTIAVGGGPTTVYAVVS